jgi:hypothetical protein
VLDNDLVFIRNIDSYLIIDLACYNIDIYLLRANAIRIIDKNLKSAGSINKSHNRFQFRVRVKQFEINNEITLFLYDRRYFDIN